MVFFVSAIIGMEILPSPPADRATRVHAPWTSSVSVDATSTCAPASSNSLARSENAMISVGQT